MADKELPMQTLEPLISQHPFFQGLEERHLKFICGCARNERHLEGEMLIREGEEANWFYVIREGRLSLEIHVPGRGPVVIQTLGEGEVLGTSWLFPPYRWQFSGRVLQPTRLLAFDGKCLRDKCDKDHDLGYELVKRAAQILLNRLDAARLQLLDLYASRP
jgi:CRP-like cAMP-binding protein